MKFTSNQGVYSSGVLAFATRSRVAIRCWKTDLSLQGTLDVLQYVVAG